uniref:Uncharacterized protein n=1 Tax=Octopus bimaculoides TaxID=37653 RepID=A0A0L8G133_OCTBM
MGSHDNCFHGVCISHKSNLLKRNISSLFTDPVTPVLCFCEIMYSESGYICTDH